MKFIWLISVVITFQSVYACYLGDRSKFVGDRCKSDSECYNGNLVDAVSCRRGQCVCNDGYVAQAQWFAPKDQRTICVNAPLQHQQCDTVCQKPYVCTVSNTSNSDSKTCQCQAPYTTKNGQCLLDCDQGEIFSYGECVKRCANGQSKNSKSICKSTGKLGHSCDDKNQCTTPYAQCINGKCACGPGFVASSSGDACNSNVHWCPFGQPIVDSHGKTVQCKVTKQVTQLDSKLAFVLPPSAQPLRDNCNVDQFCMLTSGSDIYIEDAVGHCCPKPKLSCPVGQPHPNATCGQPTPYRDIASNSNASPYCPYSTHSCVQFKLGGGHDQSLCCPITCSDQQVLVDGRCLPRRNYGDHCEHNDQCKNHYGVCEQGKCSCPQCCPVDGEGEYKTCRQRCNTNEIQDYNNRCLPRLQIGQKCNARSSQCPTNAYCNDNGVCDCYCGYVNINNHTCGPQPICPKIESGLSIDFNTKVDDFVLCQVSDDSKNRGVVKQCPNGQYCSQYVEQFGICCPKPTKPFCPNGAKPGSKCNPKDSNACGRSAFCSSYMFPVDQMDDSDAYVCCPLEDTPEIHSLT